MVGSFGFYLITIAEKGKEINEFLPKAKEKPRLKAQSRQKRKGEKRWQENYFTKLCFNWAFSWREPITINMRMETALAV